MEADEISELEELRTENARLRALLRCSGGDPAPRLIEPSLAGSHELPEAAARSTEQKIALFRRLFRGRADIYPVRWENKASKSGYAPACGNEWVPGICEKPRIKCSDCPNRMFLPVTDQVIYDHLSGRHTIGVYPLLPDDTCHFLAVDFDEADWRSDTQAFVATCRELEVPVAIEISRSGHGAHAWLFFSTGVPAQSARQLGSALISRTCARTRQLTLHSYDRLFPNQDTMPKGGFGNLIVLPLQKHPREQGRSVFVNDQLQPWADQWQFLATLPRLDPNLLESMTRAASGGAHPLDVATVEGEDASAPWRRRPVQPRRLPKPLPDSIHLTLANGLYIDKTGLTQPLTNRLIRLAAFQNPEFYRAQAMRFPVWDKPRVIGCAENFPKHVALPRGCLEAVQTLLQDNGIAHTTCDERFGGESLNLKFGGTLRPDQAQALEALLPHDTGVLSAPTAFGKTVIAAALIARRGVNTLILVHRTELLNQWRERLQLFLSVGRDVLGTIGAGKSKATGRIDIAVMQSLSRRGVVSENVEHYGQIIVDECHHLAALSFESILKRARARFVLGLTATPVRRDGQHPIIFMQCGPLRHTATSTDGAPDWLEAIPRIINTSLALPPDAAIQEVFKALATDARRTTRIVEDLRALYAEGRKILVLTERAEHLLRLHESLSGGFQNLFMLHGRMRATARREQLQTLEALSEDAPRILLATGRLIGEGFDHPPLDTLVLAMPISWKGTLQQYAGRLHRQHAAKREVRIYDYVDHHHPALRRMWEKRQRGYRAMGYRVSGAL